MDDVKKWLRKAASELETQYDLRRRPPDWAARPAHISAFRSYGTAERLHVRARVLADPKIAPATGQESMMRNLFDAYRRLESDEIPQAKVSIGWSGAVHEAIADEEGYVVVEIPNGVPTPESGWHEVPLQLVEPLLQPPVTGRAHVLVPPPGSEYGVISDLDDTVIHSEVTKKLKMLKNVLFGNARTRLPFEGVAALYTALQAGSDGTHRNPIFYVSGGPWNFYDIYHDFLDAQGIPPGPLLLADFGFAAELFIHPEHEMHKKEKIAHIVETYPSLPFILIGDSGEHDPEIYLDVARSHPGRIKRIYIRNVTLAVHDRGLDRIAEEARATGAEMVVVTTAAEAMKDAVAQGFAK